jgi:dTDP-glucose 4,6-dehydratase
LTERYDVLEIDRGLGFDLNRTFDRIVTAIDDFEPDYVVNYAAQGDDAASWVHPWDFFQTNCAALARLIDHLKEQPYLRSFLQVSSSGVYGSRTPLFTEAAQLEPESPYAVSKAAFDFFLLGYHKSFAFPVQIIRPPNLYGRHQQLWRIIPKTIMLLKRGQRIELHGGGHAIRSYLHVRDTSRAVQAMLEHGRLGQIYNVAPDDSYRIRDVVAMICDLLGKDFENSTLEVEDRRGQHSGLNLDSTKIRSELGWLPQISLRAGLEDVLRWIERDWDELMEKSLVYTHKP